MSKSNFSCSEKAFHVYSFFLFSGFLKAPALAHRVVTPIYHVEKPSSMQLKTTMAKARKTSK